MTATSAVDLDTDRAIQEIIRGPLFDEVTILTIAYVFFSRQARVLLTAGVFRFPVGSSPSLRRPSPSVHRHRLNTIIESTRVLVLDQGRVAEFDAPAVLLADKSSRFYSMALEAGLVQEVAYDAQDVQAEKEETGTDEAQEERAD
jgi:ATP-binding cassette subfamily C (CFTR/MRP) protein 1